MRILQVVPTYYPAVRYGGPIVAVHGLSKALVARGHEVHVFTTNVDGNGHSNVPVGSEVRLDGVKVTYFPAPFRRLYWSPAMGRALTSRAGEFDLVHTHAVYLYPGVAAVRAAARADVPSVISPRGMLVPDLIRSKSRLAKTLWLTLFERRTFARSSAIHFTSELELHDARKTGLPLPSPFVVPNGIDLEPKPDVIREPRTLLFLGRVNWKKRLDFVIASLPRLEGVKLLIAGNDEENLTPSLMRQAATLGVSDRVTFLGPLYGEAKQKLLASATLLVLLSTSENFGNSVLEALAMETPAVLSPGVGLTAEVVRAEAGVVGFDGVPALLADRERLAEMGSNGRRLVEERFAWPRVAEAMENAYRTCSTRSRR